ncbi:MAG TPA: xanthine dehydrogenase family protein molybdopterin-binding subunit [Myxococcales bacterium]
MTSPTTGPSKPIDGVGASVRRLDGPAKAAGAARYVADLQFADALCAKILHSPHAHAEIVSLDAEAARRAPGVHAVLTGREAQFTTGFCIRDTAPLAVDRVRWYGQPVAMVLAETEAQALDALDLIRVEYQPLEPVMDQVAAAAGGPRIHQDPASFEHAHEFFPQKDSNVFHLYSLTKGDAEKALAGCTTVHDQEYEYDLISHVQLETHGTVALWDQANALTVYSSSQSPFCVRATLAQAFGLPLNKIRVIIPAVGGGFGGKSDYTIEPLVAAAARLAKGRHVRLILDREEAFLCSLLGRGFKMRLTTGLDASGKLQAFHARLFQRSGGFGECAINVVVGGGHNCTGPFAVDNVKVEARAVYTNTPPVGAFRGYGHPEGQFMTVSQMDEMARRLGKDPLDFMAGALFEPGQKNALGQTVERGWGDLRGCVNRVIKRLRELKPVLEKEAASRSPAGRYKAGIGLAPFMKSPVMATNAASSACCRFNEDGSVQVLYSGTEIGQGSGTVMGQFAAEVLRIPIEKIETCTEPDTRFTPYEWQTVGSTSTWKVGNAVVAACKNALVMVKQNACLALGLDPSRAEEIEHDGAFLWHRDAKEKRVALKDVCYGFSEANGRTHGGPAFGYGYYMPSLTNCDPVTGQGDHAAEWTFGCQGVALILDTATGEMEMRRLITVMDIGKVVNPVLARGQVAGAVVQALGAAVSERFIFAADGKMRNPTLTDYKIPTPQDVADDVLDIEFLENPYEHGPYGARCMAEHATVGIAPAAANALRDAAGIRLTSLPLTPEKVVEALSAMKRGRS